ncbi:hypothetical protein EDD90_0828 [Streptomyces sp. Ag109_O5-1]|uniref:hypothetical protein n=1 Tax=Streptomyces sp. Ag109_O5-1 TaxID=1938851 RepID=UPI000F5163F2|nr:hypothetical protein [Streptomyces sp. Ag109_O5-1]RPE37964.1 hypothetical protein EDD90_0828 [Streptomyces sp. Ag109_O5-1]
MNKWIRRASIAVASTTLAGGALLGAGGSASAATASEPVQHAQYSSAAFASGSDRATHRADGHQSGHHDDRYRYRAGEERRDGRHLYVWDGHRWDEATTWYGVGGDRWYLDQVAWYLQQR